MDSIKTTHCLPNLEASTPSTNFPYLIAFLKVDSVKFQIFVASEKAINPSKGVFIITPFSKSSSQAMSISSFQITA